jgi:Ring finger domain
LKKSPSSTYLDDEAEELETLEVDTAAMNAAAVTVMDLEKGFSKESERTASTTDSSESGDEGHRTYSPSLPKCNSADSETHAYLRLPAKDVDGKPRCVEASCSICLGAYEPGDKVVWSGLDECKHCFHDECILPWLSKGKKRCPMCRQWFVPGTKIDDQKAALETTPTATTTTQVPPETTTATIQQGDEPTASSSLSVSNATDDLEMAPTTLSTTTQEDSDCGGLHINAGPMHDDLETGVERIVTNPAA